MPSFIQLDIDSGMLNQPNEKYRELQQAYIDQEWDNTTSRYVVKEQIDFGSSIYSDIEVWIDYVVGLGSRGTTNGDDFKRLIFQSIDHEIKRGLYYQFDDNYWITYFTDDYNSIVKDCGVRRCNNIMRIIDPENGSIFSIPCVIDYDMTSPSQQVSSYIITPNNHATIMVQGNADTLRLFKLNTRYIFGGRPFKLLAYQNALIDESIAPTPTLLYLDLYLDELHANDDIANQLADNGDYQYTIEIDSTDMESINGATGVLTATITLNGKEVNREVIWSSNDSNIVTIDSQGNYQVVGTEGQSCTITATLQGNSSVTASIKITVVGTESLQAKIIIEPIFSKIRQYETVDFTVKASYGSQLYMPSDVVISLSKNNIVLSNQYLSIQNVRGNYQIMGLQIAPTLQTLYVSVQNDTPAFTATGKFQIEVTSMMG